MKKKITKKLRSYKKKKIFINQPFSLLLTKNYTKITKTFFTYIRTIHSLSTLAAHFFLATNGFAHNIKCKNLIYNEKIKLHDHFKKAKGVIIGDKFRKLLNLRMLRLRKLGSKRYWRRSMALPTRGQRTHSNAQTFRRYYVKMAHWKNEKILNKRRKFFKLQNYTKTKNNIVLVNKKIKFKK